MAFSAKFWGVSAIALVTLGTLTACNNQTGNQPGEQTGQGGGPQTVNITLVSYAVTRGAYEQIIPKFAEEWKEKTGQTVNVEQSYGGSGSQTRAVIDGLNADVVALALGSDVDRIEQEGLIEPGWQQEFPNESIVTTSVMAFVPRDANIKADTWQDLANPSVQVITANPKTSGGARWNFLGLWGSVTQTGGSQEQALRFVEAVYKNVPILPKDAREATDVFYAQGQGNVLLNYENEVILAKINGDDRPYTIPTDFNISITNPVAVVDKNVDRNGTREVAEAFVAYLFTPEAQRYFAQVGFRPVEPTVFTEFSEQFPTVDNLATIQDFGGWEEAQPKFFGDDDIFDKVMTAINK